MANTRELRMRIRAVQNIQKITRAMQMIAASRLKRAQDTAIAAGPYSEKLAFMMRELSSARGAVKHPLLEIRPIQKRLIVVITSEKGLCGAYNANVLRKLRDVMQEGPPAEVLTVGKKARDFLRFRKLTPVEHVAMPASGADLGLVQALVRRVVKDYAAAKYDQVTLVYTRFYSAVSTVPTAVQLLPLAAADDEDGDDTTRAATQFIFEPSPEALLPMLLEKYVANQLYRGLVDAYASELGARMVAMKNATDNADELIGTLKLTYNRVRQASITKELLEIVGGADALAD